MTVASRSANPLISFDDFEAGLRMMVDVFGFEERAVIRDEESGAVLHCEVVWGETVVMPSERKDSVWSLGPTSLFLSTDNPDELHDRAVTAGLEIVIPLTDQDYGSREFAAKDASGNVWIFGTYNAAAGPNND
jgi:uncharacterized glyoxalase superfamily protein PhnB